MKSCNENALKVQPRMAGKATQLREYRVYLSSLLPNEQDTGMELVGFVFDCRAEDEAHAEEQAQNAYPEDMVECVELKYEIDC